MFTGLIETVATVARVDTVPSGYRLRLDTPLGAELQLGESVSIDGVCLTVTARDAAGWEADVGPETARVTTLGTFTPGRRVNLERSMRADSRFGGHLVQGHVDATGTVGRPPVRRGIALDRRGISRATVAPCSCERVGGCQRGEPDRGHLSRRPGSR
jgi:riboflavin synthase alpha subunit